MPIIRVSGSTEKYKVISASSENHTLLNGSGNNKKSTIERLEFIKKILKI